MSLLRLRQEDRQRRRVELAKMYETDEILAQRQEELRHRHNKLLAQCRDAAGPGPLDVEAMVEYRRYSEFITAQQDELEQQRQLAALEIDRRRTTLLAANREVRMLEMLHEKQQNRRRQREARRETKMLDEIAVNRCAG